MLPSLCVIPRADLLNISSRNLNIATSGLSDKICQEPVYRDLFGVVYIINLSTGSSKRVNIVIMEIYPIIKTLRQPSWVKFGKSQKKLGDVLNLINC